ncbi:MAG: prephenate dehydrogenase [Clostridiaceae bacterium]
MENSDFSDFTIAVVGLGLIGGSYAMALKKLNPREICGIDMDEETIEKALRAGIIDRGCCNPAVILGNADLVVIALYPEEAVKFLRNNVSTFKKDAVITDTCGIKKGIIAEVHSFLPKDIDFIGGHPMAGKETKGLQSADRELFRDANYIITPVERNKDKNVELICKVAKAIGCKNVVSITPEEHDRIVSFTSQLPHVIAVSLINSNEAEGHIAMLTGGSFKDATRVAAVNSILWTQLFTLNSDNLIDEIEKFEENIKTIKKAIKSEDKNALDDIFKNAAVNKRKMMVLNEKA